MEQELISKRELLELYDISYGALYRWKRHGLIPDEWFIKKSTVTGQETFFPRRLVCERMEIIKRQKDDVSLKELAKLFSKESERNAAVIIDTVFGKKTFYLNEIKSLIIDNGDGTKKDITNDILGANK